jgi:hypothetical protein
MSNPEIRTESVYEERRSEFEQAQHDRCRFQEAPDKMAEIREAVASMQQHFANLAMMPADYRFDRYSIAGFLMWVRNDLERAAKLLGMTEEPAQKAPLTEEEPIF